MGLDRPAVPVILGIACRQHPDLPGNKGNDGQGDFLAGLGKSGLALEEFKQHSEPEPGRPAFVGQQVSLAGQQYPMLGEYSRHP
jgi:hypothetical protein